MQRFTKDQIAARVARDIPDGAYVNLGIGLPTMVANHLPKDREIILHTENGLLGMGPAPAKSAEDPDLINAGKQPVTALPGASFFHHARFVRDDARRSSRLLRARRLPGVRQGRPRQLAHGWQRRHSRGWWRNGSRYRREAGVRDDGAPHQARRKQDRRSLHLSRHRPALRQTGSIPTWPSSMSRAKGSWSSTSCQVSPSTSLRSYRRYL